jgi:hypothetical protein
MDTLPLKNEIAATRDRLGEQTSHLRTFDANAEHDFRHGARAKQVDLSLPSPDYMNVRWFVIERVDDKPKAMRAVDHSHLRD